MDLDSMSRAQVSWFQTWPPNVVSDVSATTPCLYVLFWLTHPRCGRTSAKNTTGKPKTIRSRFCRLSNSSSVLSALWGTADLSPWFLLVSLKQPLSKATSMPSMIILLIIWKKLFQSGPRKFVGKFPDEVALRRNKNFCQKMHLKLACQYGVPQNQTGSWACGIRIIHTVIQSFALTNLTTWVAVKKITKSPFLPLGAAHPEPGRTMTHGLVKHLKSFLAVRHGRQRNPQDHAILWGFAVGYLFGNLPGLP